MTDSEHALREIVRGLVTDLGEGLDQSNQVLLETWKFLGTCGCTPTVIAAKRVLWSRIKANEVLLARVKEATRTGSTYAKASADRTMVR